MLKNIKRMSNDAWTVNVGSKFYLSTTRFLEAPQMRMT